MSTTTRPKLIDLVREMHASKAAARASSPTPATTTSPPSAKAPAPAAPAIDPNKPATPAMLREAFADDPEFVADAYERRLSMGAAWGEYTRKLRQVRDTLRARAAHAQAQQQYPAAVEQVMRARGLSRAQAVEAVNTEQPELRAAYLGRASAASPAPLTPYECEVQRVKRDRKCSMAEAVNIVNSTRPDLRAAYLNR